MIYLETGSTDPYYNLAFEEYVLTNKTDDNYLILWQNEPTVVVGLNQNTEAEINRDYIQAHQIHVVRRSTGGGAVFHDLGNLNYSFVADAEDAEKNGMAFFTTRIVDALCALGLSASASGRNDILVAGKKVSGTAQRVYKNRILFHGTLLFDSDFSMLTGALNVDPQKYTSKGKKSVQSHVGNIRQLLPEDMSLREFKEYIKSALLSDEENTGKLDEVEFEQIKKLREEKYATWEWNYGHSPEYQFSNKRRWKQGSLEVWLSVHEGTITDIGFWGDYLALDSSEDLCKALKACSYRIEDVSAILDRFPLHLLFGGITRQELLETLFP